ncbi:MAG: sugar kinase [Nocardioidaceae bacterium]
MVDVLTLGEVLASLRAHGPVRTAGRLGLSVAGAEANVCIGLARLGHLARFVGVVGGDQLGALAVRTLRAEGVDISALRRSGSATGIVLFERRLPGVSRVDYHRTSSAGTELAAADVDRAWDPAPRILHVTGITTALGDGCREAVRHAVATARTAGTTVCLDINDRRRLWPADQARAVLQPLVDEVDILVGSEEEIALVAADPAAPVDGQARELLARGVTEVVVKQGADGATLHRSDGTTAQPAHPVEAVDPVGAGDAFVAGYLSATLDGLAPAARLARGVAVGAFAVAGVGDWEGLPTRDELDLLASPDGSVIR